MGVITVLSQILLQTISCSSLQYLVQQNYPSLNSPAFWKGVFSWIYTLRLIFRYCSILRWYRLILPLFANILSFSSSRTTETFPAIGICSPVYVFKFAFVLFSGLNFPRSSEYYAASVSFLKLRFRVPCTVCGFPHRSMSIVIPSFLSPVTWYIGQTTDLFLCVGCVQKTIGVQRSNGIKIWKITYSVILNVLSNMTKLILSSILYVVS